MDEVIYVLGEVYVVFVWKYFGLYEVIFLWDEEVRKVGDGIVKFCF